MNYNLVPSTNSLVNVSIFMLKLAHINIEYLLNMPTYIYIYYDGESPPQITSSCILDFYIMLNLCM